MKSTLRKLGLILACAAFHLVSSQADVAFQLRESGTGALNPHVAPGALVTIEVVALNIQAGAGVVGNLDSFTYRIIFPNQDFDLTANAFSAPFDNNQVPAGFNGSIPWSPLPVPINFLADAGSPGATALEADIYRTTATTTGVPVVAPGTVLETLTVQAPAAPGNYQVGLNVLEAADVEGALHLTSNGDPFVI